jgi:dolichol-phosphate mannosyltransferase
MESDIVKLDIIIPVYNEEKNIVEVLDSFKKYVHTKFRVLICYDHDNDNTLPVIKEYSSEFKIIPIKNKGKGVHGAILTGFDSSDAECVIVFPADDTYNASILDKMYEKFREGYDIVAASRFMKGGRMEGCPWLKSVLVRTASFTLFWFSSIPIRDASNGFRLFSRRNLDTILIESRHGFTYSLELLVKTHRLKWKIGEVPSSWIERTKGGSRFQVIQWLPHYVRWYLYGFATTWLRIKNVKQK